MLSAIFSGLGIGVALAVFAVILAGTGHGSYWPMRLFFAPLFSGPVLVELVAGPLLYGAYAALLVLGKQIDWGMRVFVIIVILHYACLGLALFVVDEEFSYLEKVWKAMPLYAVGAALTFMAAHWLGWRYVVRSL
ncbi:MAG: hypothetical protein HYR55_08560 [Acidobacteria bacterium]|nr:hypothetical protein [Acidobacteriota bacterium]MBI3656376.1 hypothetical protein [Acidobacteriota bacterium]